MTAPLLGVLLAGCSFWQSAPEPDLFPTRSVTRAAPLAPPEKLVHPESADPNDPAVQVRLQALSVRDGPAMLVPLPQHPTVWTNVPAAASCSELAAVLPEPPSPTTLHALALCGEPGHRERFRRSDTPPSAVLLWGTSMAYRAEAIPGFVYDAAVRLAPSDSGWGDLGELMDLTCETDRPDLAPQLRAILAASPPSTRDGLAARCPHQTDPEIARLFRRACGDCEIPPDPLEDPDGAVRSTWWLPGLFTRYPQYRSAFLEALARCAQDPDEPAAAPCLEALAEEDWATAAQVSANLAPSAERPMAEVQETLARFGSQADLKRHLHGIGLLTSDSAPQLLWRSPEARVLTILGNHQQLMATRGTIGPELAHLAIRVPGLEQAIVEEIPAPFDSSESMTTLRIWIGDTRYQALVPYEADPGDVQMRFLNAVLEQEGLGSRVARPTAAPGSLVFGEGEALRTLHDTWLLRLENYGDWSD